MFILQDLWNMVIFPRITIKKIIDQGKLSIALLITLIWWGFFEVVATVERHLLFSSMFSLNLLNTLFNKSLIEKYLIYFTFFLMGYTVIHLLCFIFSPSTTKTYCYNRLLVIGGYLMTIGMPFVVFYKESLNPSIFIITEVLGFPSLLIFLIKLTIIFITKITIWTKWLAIISGLLGFFVFIWLTVLTIISVKEIYQLSTKKAGGIVGISEIIFFILAYIFAFLNKIK